MLTAADVVAKCQSDGNGHRLDGRGDRLLGLLRHDNDPQCSTPRRRCPMSVASLDDIATVGSSCSKLFTTTSHRRRSTSSTSCRSTPSCEISTSAVPSFQRSTRRAIAYCDAPSCPEHRADHGYFRCRSPSHSSHDSGWRSGQTNHVLDATCKQGL